MTVISWALKMANIVPSVVFRFGGTIGNSMSAIVVNLIGLTEEKKLNHISRKRQLKFCGTTTIRYICILNICLRKKGFRC